ncbi:right-handed parallel beta-helix repeat-containing protein [Phytoactinopolyspora halotolerans]|uniref:Right handed beta helix domain-containing protein n=1 Tax=Phytoactinopolyspora halotolerans TaxID=1981512 RepID=A0A6L9S6D8_9ACTN|nr:right-handed parallel beta-helix repeat-containing protein [Phytoactinopolyspora halotolerans]NED99609.1 hypothetical protein [Phytoactinopolyspora halotolerans]
MAILAVVAATILAGTAILPQQAEAIGVPNDVDLTPSEQIIVTEPGTVIDALEVHGYILIKADNVTIKRTRVVHRGYHSVRVFPGVSGTIIEDSEIECGDPSRTNGLVFGNYTARRVDVTGCRNSFMYSGSSPAVIVDSRADGDEVNVLPEPPLPEATRTPTPSGSPSPTSTASPSPIPTRSSPPTDPTAIPTPSPTGPNPSPTATQPPTTDPDPDPTTDPDPDPTTDPDPDPEPPDNPNPPSVNGFPDESNTGVQDDTQLKPSGSLTSTRDGQVIENLEITGSITVEHNNVTIRNVRIHSTGHYGISIPAARAGNVSGLVIEHSELIGVSGERSAGIAPFGSWTARHLDISAFEDGIKVGSNQTIENSWIHDLHTPPGSHSDGIQSTGGTNVTIRGNRIEGPWQGQTSAIIIQSNNGPVDTYTIENNLLSGGTYTLYLRDKGTGHGAPRNITVTNNTWTNNSWAYGPTSTDQGPNWTWNNNHTDTGTTID